MPMVEHVYPVTLGRDFAGAVEAVGEAVTSVAPATRCSAPSPPRRLHAGAWAELISSYGGGVDVGAVGRNPQPIARKRRR